MAQRQRDSASRNENDVITVQFEESIVFLYHETYPDKNVNCVGAGKGAQIGVCHSLAILHFTDVNIIVAHSELPTTIHPIK